MKRRYALILVVLLLAFGLRVWNLAYQSFWWDEAFIYAATSRGVANLLTILQTSDRHPPLYHALIAMWGNFGGWSEFSMRFVSVAWSMIALAFLFDLAKRLYNTAAGWWTLALAAVAPALVVYAQEARMYTEFFALAAATLYFVWRISEPVNRMALFDKRRLAWGLLLCEVGLLLTHYFAVPFVIALNGLALWMLYQRRAARKVYVHWVALQAVAIMPLLIWGLTVVLTPNSMTQMAESAPNLSTFARQVLILWLSGVRDLTGEWIGLSVLALLLLPFVIGGAWQVNGRQTRRMLALFALSLGLAYALTSILTAFHPRYALPYSAPLFVLVGAALSDLPVPRGAEEKSSRRKRWLIGAATASVVLAALGVGWQAASAPSSAKDDARGMAAYLKSAASADDVILQEANDYTLNYYDHGPAQTKMITATNEIDALAQLRSIIGIGDHVWLPHWNISTQDPRGYWPFLLELAGSLKSQTSFRGYDLTEYELRSPLHEPDLKPAPSEGLIARRSGLEGQGTDGALALALMWRPPVRFFDPARASVRLIDARGNALSTRDAALLDERGRTTDQWDAVGPVTNYYVLPIPPGTPPGTYTVTAQLYNAHDVLSTETVGTVDVPRRLDTSDPYRSLAGYNWRALARPQIAAGLTLEAYSVSPQMPWQPMPLDVTLRWRKTGDTSDLAPRLRLMQADRVWREIGSVLLERDYPVDQWAEGETVIDRLKIDYPPVRGPIDLQIGQGDHWTTLTTLQLDESRLAFQSPSMGHTQSAQFGDFAALSGYDLQSDSLSPARPLDLRLYWRATNTEPITTPYTVFAQVLAPDGHLVAQHDAPPSPPTRQWVPGQIVADNHLIRVVDPAYRGPATLIIGWYNSATIERVPVQGGGDSVTLSVPVRVESPQ